MSSDVITVSENTKFKEALQKLADRNMGYLIVLSDADKPIGIVTERDVTRVAATMSNINDLSVSDVMSKNLVTIYKNAEIITAIEKMEKNQIRRLVVVDMNDMLKGVITYPDIVKKMEGEFFKFNTTIGSIMTVEVLAVSSDSPLKSAIQKMFTEKKSSIFVISDNKPYGIITEKDVIRFLVENTDMDAPAGNVCRKGVIYLEHKSSIYEAIRMMNELNIRHLMAVDDDLELRGIISQTDMIKLLHENLSDMIKDQLQGFKESFDILQTGFVEFELNNEGTILWINKYGAEELGFESAANALGSSFVALLKNKEQWSQFLRQSDKSTAAINFIFDIEGKVLEGIFKIVESTASGVFKDITQFFAERESVRNEKNKFENILKNLTEGIMIVDKNGIVKEANDALLALLGISKDGIIGKSYYSTIFSFVDETGNIFDEDKMLYYVLNTGMSVNNVIRGYKRADGTIIWFKTSMTPILNTESGVEEVVVVVTDITELYRLKKRNQTILETAREGFWDIRLDGTILEINKSLCNLLGYKIDELLGKSIFSLVDSEGEKIFEQALDRRKMGMSDNYEITLEHKNGSSVYVIVSATPNTDSSIKIEGEYAFVTDITDFKFTHNMLHTIAAFSNDITRSLAEKEAYEILELYLLSIRKGEDRINAVYFVNVDIDNHHAEEVINYNDSGLEEISKFPGLDKCIAYMHGGTFLSNDLSKDLHCPFERFGAKSGSYYCIPIKIGGSEAGILHLYSKCGNFFTEEVKKTIDSIKAVFAPVISNIRLLEINKRLALTDSLTGLFNRRYFEIFMDKHLAIASRNDQFLSLIMFDIDNFKSLNDAHGHDAGDLILRNISKTLNENIRSSDIGVRYGGEEFAVILPSTDKMSAFDVAEKIRDTIEKTPIYITRGKKVFITASFGIATYGLDATSIDNLVSKADSALYAAKKSGKNRTCLA